MARQGLWVGRGWMVGLASWCGNGTGTGLQLGLACNEVAAGAMTVLVEDVAGLGGRKLGSGSAGLNLQDLLAFNLQNQDLILDRGPDGEIR